MLQLTMDLRQLKYFLAAAKLENLSAAANKLNVTHPALGQQIKKLEDQLATKLFERHSRGVSLTPAGYHLIKHAEDIIYRFGVAKSEMEKFSSEPVGTVSIGVTPSLGRVFAPTLLEECAMRFPRLRIKFVQDYADPLEQLITKGELNVAFVHSRIDNPRLESVPLFVETIYLIGTHSLLANLEDPAPVHSLLKLPLILDSKGQFTRRALEQVIGDSTKTWDTALEVQAINIRREFVMQGKRCTFAPIALFSDEIRDGQLEKRRVDLIAFTRILGLATPRVEDLSPALATIRSLAIEIVDKIIERGTYGWSTPKTDW